MLGTNTLWCGRSSEETAFRNWSLKGPQASRQTLQLHFNVLLEYNSEGLAVKREIHKGFRYASYYTTIRQFQRQVYTVTRDFPKARCSKIIF
jgi:hypothetical protein